MCVITATPRRLVDPAIAHLGLTGIPEKYVADLELKDVILEVADDLWHDCQINEYTYREDPEWGMKYFKNRRVK